MRLSVIVPGFGSQRALAETQAAHIRATLSLAAVDGEVIVADGKTIGMARNNGLRAARGEWIAWVDADDEVTGDWAAEIDRAVTAAGNDAKSQIDSIVFDMVLVRRGRTVLHRYGREQVVDASVLAADILREMRIGGHLFRHVSRRSRWKGVRFADVAVMEDALVLPQVLARCRRVAYVDKPLYRYVERADSLCTSVDPFEFFAVSRRRVERGGAPAAVGASVSAYNCLYDKADRKGEARRWIRRHLPVLLRDGEVPRKWKLKFVLAALGVIVRRPK